MKSNNVYKENTNYFTRGELMKFIGVGLAVVAAALYFFGWGYASYIIASVGLPAGIVLFIIGSIGRSSESDLDSFIAAETDDIEKRDLVGDPLEKRILRHIPPLSAAGYEYPDGALLRKDKGGTVRSSVYTASKLYALKDSLYVEARRVSLISDDKEDIKAEIPYSSITSLSFSEEERRISFKKNTFKIKDTRLIVLRDNGEKLSLPVKGGMDVDIFSDKVNALIVEK